MNRSGTLTKTEIIKKNQINSGAEEFMKWDEGCIRKSLEMEQIRLKKN